MSKRKFKPGDLILIIDGRRTFKNLIGTVTDVDYKDFTLPYRVYVNERQDYMWFEEHELAPYGNLSKTLYGD